MADAAPLAPHLTAQTTPPRREQTGQPVPPGDHTVSDGRGEGNCPLWDGHIVDATFPPV